MTEEQLNNIDKPAHVDWEVTAAEAIKCINRLLDSDEVQDDDYADAMVVKAYLVDTLPNTPVQPKMSKNIPVMETTIEGAQKRITHAIESIESGRWGRALPDLEYIGVFLDTVGDEMAAISSAHNSLHERYVQAIADIDSLKSQAKIDKATINASLSSIHAANDNR